MKKMVLFAAFLIIGQLITKGQNNVENEIVIGKQTWTAENLVNGNFRNGDPIPEAKTEDEWVKAAEEGKPAYTVYDFDYETGVVTGMLFNWFAVTDPRGFAPNGWHVPSDAEWAELANSLGGAEAATIKLKSSSGWEEGSQGNNESNFDGLPGGKINQEGIFEDLGYFGYWWSSSESEGFGLNRNLSAENFPFEAAQSFKGAGFSVRLVKD